MIAGTEASPVARYRYAYCLQVVEGMKRTADVKLLCVTSQPSYDLRAEDQLFRPLELATNGRNIARECRTQDMYVGSWIMINAECLQKFGSTADRIALMNEYYGAFVLSSASLGDSPQVLNPASRCISGL